VNMDIFLKLLLMGILTLRHISPSSREWLSRLIDGS